MKSSDDLDRKMTSGSIKATEKEAEDGPRRRKMRNSNGTEEGAEVMPTLPQEMVEKIVAIVPFPSIFKAVCLSRSWRARFSPILLLKDVEMERGTAAAFQKQVIAEWGKNWDTFCPVFVGKDHLVAYCQKSCNWQRFSLSFLPEMLPTQSRRYTGLSLDAKDRLVISSSSFPYVVHMSERSLSPDDLQINGALLYTFHQSELYVADILTQRWKQLPRRPIANRTFVVWSKVVSNVLLGTYKVVLFCRDDCPRGHLLHHRLLCSHDHFSAQIYESNSRTWSTQNFSVTKDYTGRINCRQYSDWSQAWSAVYLNGVFYMVPFGHLQHFLAFNLAEGTLEELRLSLINKVTWTFVSANLLVCNDNRLMMVTTDMNSMGLQILRVDLHSLQLKLLHRGDLPAPFETQTLAPNPVSDGNCIFFRPYQRVPPHEQGPDEMRREPCCSEYEDRSVLLSYNVNEEAWSAIPIPAPAADLDIKQYRWIGASFQPSLSAFVAL